MELLPHPLFASARILNDSDLSGSSSLNNSINIFLNKFDTAIQSQETYKLASKFLANRREWSCYNNCRRAIERLILWALLIKKKSVLSLDRSDAFEFIWFAQDPPDSWLCEKAPLRFMMEISRTGLKTVVPNPKWRPFAKGRLPTEPSTLYTMLIGCSTFFNYLIGASSVLRNPFAELISQLPSADVVNPPCELSMKSSDWEEVLFAAERLADKDPIMHERTLFMVAAQAHLNISCSDFFDSESKIITLNSFVRNEAAWLLRLESGDIAVSDEFINDYVRRFCNFRGVVFELHGALPVVTRVKGFGQVTRRTLVKITNDAVCEALRYMENHGAPQARLLNLRDVYKVWLHSDAATPKRCRPIEISRASQEEQQRPRPLFADYVEVERHGWNVDDHPDTLLYLDSCPEVAMPRKAYEHAKEYLCKFRNKNTYETYRKYIERLLLWTFLIKKRSIYDLTEIDLHEFNGFCKFPPDDWVRIKFERRFIQIRAGSRNRGSVLTTMNSEWRPFLIDDRRTAHGENIPYHSSSETSAGQFTVARNFYCFLLSKQAVEFNPLNSPDAFASYSQKRRSPPKTQQGVSSDAFQKLIEGCFAMLAGWNLRRMLFIIYTVNELQLSLSDIKASGRLLTFSCFDEGAGMWSVAFPGADERFKSSRLSSEYVEEVLLPYRRSLQQSNSAFTESCPLFSSRISGLAISGSRISDLLLEVCQCTAMKMESSHEDYAFIEAVRGITINSLVSSSKPTEYLLKKALNE